jgi:hypothetical protein
MTVDGHASNWNDLVLENLMKRNIRLTCIVAALLWVGVVSPAFAGTYSGTVEDVDGNTMAGVMIRVSDRVSGMSESIFSDGQGRFRLGTALQGRLDVGVGAPY